MTSIKTFIFPNTHSTSASPTFFFLMAYCRQWLRVLVSSRFVDLRIISSTSVELHKHTDTQAHRHTHTQRQQQKTSDYAEVISSISQRKLQCLEANINSLSKVLCLKIYSEKKLNASQFKCVCYHGRSHHELLHGRY